MEKSHLENKLMQYVDSDYIPFHMPGHKRNEKYEILNYVNKYDLTEIDGFDNYHHPTDILKDIFDRAKYVYKSDKSYYLVNGCSVGLLASVAALFNEGDKILMARNCHKSVYNAIYLNKLNPVYVYPDMYEDTGIYKGLTASDIENVLKAEKGIKGIILTSPTYEGVVSDIEGIANVAHAAGIPLIVDEAHGAHFHFSKHFPCDALSLGADVVIEGLHKTLPSLTQTAIMHISGKHVDISRMDRYVSMYQTTSPSYLFLCSIEHAIECALDEQAINEYVRKLNDFYNKVVPALRQLKVFCERDDISKIVIKTCDTSISGTMLAGILRDRYKIETEMASLRYIVLMTTFCDNFEHYDILADALLEIDKSLIKNASSRIDFKEIKNKQLMSPYDGMNKDTKRVALDKASGYISSDYIYVYPPGIPVIAPGEVFDEDVIDAIKHYIDGGLYVIGLHKEKEVFVIR